MANMETRNNSNNKVGSFLTLTMTVMSLNGVLGYHSGSGLFLALCLLLLRGVGPTYPSGGTFSLLSSGLTNLCGLITTAAGDPTRLIQSPAVMSPRGTNRSVASGI